MNRPTTHWPQLDGLRGIAVLLVFVCHAQQYRSGWFPRSEFVLKGWIGVDLFFVLSGFLITGILIGAKGSPNYFRAFYGRRSLRIWPIYFLLLALVFVVLPHLSGKFSALVSTAGPAWIYVLFLQNVLPYHRPAPLVATWSLAVEEQFYICWSLLVAYLSVKNLRRLMWALLVLAPIVRTLAFRAGVSPSYVYFNLFHIDGLALGSICAIVFRERGDSELRVCVSAVRRGGVCSCGRAKPSGRDSQSFHLHGGGTAVCWSPAVVTAKREAGSVAV